MNTSRHHWLKRGFLATIAVAILAMLIGSGLSAPPAQAAYIVTLEQVGNNVVATGSGTINTAGLNLTPFFPEQAEIEPAFGTIITGPATPTSRNASTGVVGPTSFGSGGTTLATIGSGDIVGITGSEHLIDLPVGYFSGSQLSDTATYTNRTFTTLDVTPGTYVWVWGSGADADFFKLQIGAVPAPLIGHGLPVLLAVGALLFGAKLLERTKKQQVA